MAAKIQSKAHAREINPDAMNALMGRAVQDMGAALQAPLILIGDKLGFTGRWAMVTPVTSAELAKKTGDVGEVCSRVAECECGGAAGAV